MATCPTSSVVIARQSQESMVHGQVRKQAGDWYPSSMAQERPGPPGLSLRGLLGPWVGGWRPQLRLVRAIKASGHPMLVTVYPRAGQRSPLV